MNQSSFQTAAVWISILLTLITIYLTIQDLRLRRELQGKT